MAPSSTPNLYYSQILKNDYSIFVIVLLDILWQKGTKENTKQLRNTNKNLTSLISTWDKINSFKMQVAEIEREMN